MGETFVRGTLAAGVMAALADAEVETVEHAVVPVNFACPNLILDRDGQRTGISDVMTPGSAAIAQA